MGGNEALLHSFSKSYALAASKHELVFFGDLIEKNGISAFYQQLEEGIVRENISLLLLDISTSLIDPFSIYNLKQKYGFMVVLLALDDEFKFEWLSSSLATIADLVLSCDCVSVDRYRQSGVNAHFLPLPVEISHKFSVNHEGYKHEVSFVGRIASDKGLRVKFRDYLDHPDHDFNITWMGNSGKKGSTYLSRSEMFSVFNNSLINLNFTDIVTYVNRDNPLFKRIRGIKFRPFEVAAAAGFCLSEFSIGLEKCFKDQKEIVFFRNKKELVEKINYYLSHPDEAREIAKAGQKRVKESYSSEKIAIKFKELIYESLSNSGKDLFKEKLKPNISQQFAIDHVSQIFLNSLTFLQRFKIGLFFREISFLLRFLFRISSDFGLLITMKLILIIAYQTGKTMIASMINRFRKL